MTHHILTRVLRTGGLLILLPGFAGLAGCAMQGPRYAADARMSPPDEVMMAELPRNTGGSEGYQGHRGPAYYVGSAPALNDTGSEGTPDYPAGAEPPVVYNRSGLIMPNGGETIVQSAASLPN